MMRTEAAVIVSGLIAGAVIVLYCPILKPWFGFRKPAGHRGRWFQ